MYYYHTNDEIDEIGEGLIRKYNYQAFIQGDPTDIEGFIADNLNYRIVYDRLADKDAGRMAFLADGKDTMWVWRDGKRVEVIPPEGMIVIDEFLRQEKNKTRRRFILAHSVLKPFMRISISLAFPRMGAENPNDIDFRGLFVFLGDKNMLHSLLHLFPDLLDSNLRLYEDILNLYNFCDIIKKQRKTVFLWQMINI